MRSGSENRKKTILAASLGTVALICVIYAYTQLFGSPGTPPPSIAPVVKPVTAQPVASIPTSGPGSRPAAMPTGNAPGIGAKKLATASASLDPSLDQAAMLRTEHLVYAGSGRNIFSALYTPPPPRIPKPVAPPRPIGPVLPPPPPPPPPTCPPTCPPIPLKFFGTATRANGTRQAFLLQGDDVFLAAAGDIVARRYRIVSISANSLQVEDMTNNYTQTLPLQSN